LKATLNWIKEFLDIEKEKLDPEEIAHLLTMSGTEVKKVENFSGRYKNMVVGRITDFEKHPDADKLSVCRVDAGDEVLNIVCGASNFKKNDRVVVACEGAVTVQGLKIKKSRLRGILSEGMLCSESELGLGAGSEGIMILGDDARPGISFAVYAGLDDVAFELEVTPNRPDCLSISGIAREISALKKIKYRFPQCSCHDEINIKDSLRIEISDYGLCPRYSAKIFSDVPGMESPLWLKNRLLMCDYRPVDLVVDLTNYVMHETGQPLHAFDRDLLYSDKIIVRTAAAGENIRCIDDNLRSLTGRMLVIADEKKPVAIAGVMGGKDTEINPGTRNILLEAANFSGPSVLKTSADLGLRSEASNRFEKKLDPELTIVAVKRFEELLSEITKKYFEKGIYDNYREQDRARKIILNPARVENILGKKIEEDEITDILSGLGIEKDKSGSDEGLPVFTVPSFRFEDLERDIDLIEEIARIHGFEKFKSSPPSTLLMRGGRNSMQKIVMNIKKSLSCAGLNEVINYSFLSEEWFNKLKLNLADGYDKPVRIINPINEDFTFLRTGTLPSMVKNLITNLNRDLKDVYVYEVSKVHKASAEMQSGLPEESLVLGILISGKAVSKSWNRQEKYCDFFDMKGIIEYLMEELSIDASSLEISTADFKFFHPVINCCLKIKGENTGIAGKLHPLLLDGIDVRQDVYYSELWVDSLVKHIRSGKDFMPITQFPAIEIDIAVVVDESVKHAELEAEIRKTENCLLKEVRLFDIYRGPQVDKTKKSMAYKLTFQDDSRTLKDSEVDIILNRILDKLSGKFNAKLRQ
jgi:phenylalanyl-tRNA synthetase beta chain